MAESRDEQPTGRMLFTDFDASDKGRPTVDLREMQGDHRERRGRGNPIRNLDDLASSLDFGFEDDDGEPAPPPPAKMVAANRRPAHPTEDQEPEKNEPFHIPDDAELWGTPRHSSPIPTWDQYASSFMKSPSRRQSETDVLDNPYVHDVGDYGEPAQDYAKPPPIPGTMSAEDDGDVDILSLLSADGDAGEDPVHRPFEGDWRGQRLGVEPPRARPYGGIQRLEEWYRPPENIEEHSVESVADWYEPPEEGVQQEPPDRRKTEQLGAPVDRPKRQGAEERHGDIDSRTIRGRRGSDTTRQVDMFNDIDVDTLWNEKIEAKQSEPGDGSTSTRDFMLFDDKELDNAWESKQADSQGKQPGESGKPEETIILGPGAYDSASTLILSQEELNRSAGSFASSPGNASTIILTPEEIVRHAAFKPSDEKKKSARSTARPPQDGGDPGASDLFEGLDKLFGDIAAEDPLKAGAHPLPRQSAPPQPSSGEADPFDLDQLIAMTDTDEPAVNDSIAAPVIGDADITDLRKKKHRTAEAETETVEFSQPDPVMETDSDSDGGHTTPEHDDAYIPSDLAAADEPPANADATIPPSQDGGEPPPAEEEEQVAVNPMDVFANMDDMDFSDDGLDDEMKAMLDDDAAVDDEASPEGGAGDEMGMSPPPAEKPPEGLKGKIVFFAGKMLRKVIPQTLLGRVTAMIAWKENWWFYCDLIAAIIASASLAIIISYYIWYRH